MKSLKYLYKIGRGPSSSHTMGPDKAARYFKNAHPDADSYKVILYGSLSSTGKGHKTDEAILDIFEGDEIDLVFGDGETASLPHENTMEFYAYKNGEQVGFDRIMSVGGGAIVIEGKPELDEEDVYPLRTFGQIADYCSCHNMRLWEYVEKYEGEEIWNYLHEIWKAMKNAVNAGLSTRGVLDGGLGVERKAQYLYNQSHIDESEITKENRLVCAYAFAVSEHNAGGGVIVTAPTCGACAVLPSVLKYMQDKKGFTDDQICRALAVGGLVGNLVKTNASISGAECGCQAEIGTACSMAAAALCELFGMGIGQIEYAAEVAMEHMLGLTCDPVCGLVQIPCIERNAVAAMRAINALSLANFLSTTRKISFDTVVETMYRTGKDLNAMYRETSQGGLAVLYHQGC
ncbi:MAG: L-serine ammonia-lyase, iron-sulfur-dependent, subunit alpha [Acutalibacteraceae bacterium]|nr:L-serine ammonia-lyase, iron-sulfur-dependent, subunit alpha [Acutalibacteraceae bacterium]